MSGRRWVPLLGLWVVLSWPGASMAQESAEPGVTLGQVHVAGADHVQLENSAPTPLSLREQFIGWMLAGMTTLAVASLALHGRVSARTHVALAALSVLIGGFGVFVILHSSNAANPWLGGACFVGLFLLLRLLSQFERA